ncbi:MAG: putative metal-binding motif-containing protein, partial [Myxococcota bacterium]|nr:putative metal-binding motif-containing protein [Myxococcota bacterium]
MVSVGMLVLGCDTGDKVGEESVDEDDVSDALAVDADGDGYDDTEDCDDNNSVVNPSAAEICDGVDNNCDGQIDEGVSTTYYADADGDGFGDEGSPTEACEQPSGYVPIGNDCNDTTAEAFPGAEEKCDGVDNNCDGEIDEGLTEAYYADGDGDGFGDETTGVFACEKPSGMVSDGDDCDDTSADVFPGNPEVCDEADNDCDGDTDEGVTTTYYEDVDGDAYGISDSTTESCDLPTGYSASPGDCDDAASAINPDAVEVCDDIDNDCDGDSDEGLTTATYYEDGDGDGYGDASASTEDCEAPSGYVSDDTDCDDADSTVNPGESEVCNEIDDDCNGSVDDGVTSTWYADDDGDGYGDDDTATEGCDPGGGYIETDGDCDDADADINPDAAEVCDEADNDCDGSVDEGVT